MYSYLNDIKYFNYRTIIRYIINQSSCEVYLPGNDEDIITGNNYIMKNKIFIHRNYVIIIIYHCNIIL